MLRLLLHSPGTLLQKHAFLLQRSYGTLVLYQLVLQSVDECALHSQLFLKLPLLMHQLLPCLKQLMIESGRIGFGLLQNTVDGTLLLFDFVLQRR